MTEHEKAMAKALAGCTFVPGTGTKRFARDMALRAEHKPNSELTFGQATYLASAVVRFRRQIDPAVVEIARRYCETSQTKTI